MSTDKKAGSFAGNDESLSHYRTPEWYRDAKLGIFIHWGIYSVPAGVNEWYPKQMYNRPRDLFRKYPPDPRVWWHHRRFFGGRRKTGYKDFIKDFTGSQWNPADWAESFKRWGARYVVPVGEHHDGFPMYKTKHTKWNAREMGPKRDVIRELRTEILKKDMHFGISTHRAFNWHYYRFYKGDDTMNPGNRGLYGTPHKWNAPESDAFLKDWESRVHEMIEEFKPEVLYFDFGWHRPRFETLRKPMAAWYYNHAVKNGYEPVLNYKNQDEKLGGSAGFEEGSAVLDIERGASADIREHPWQTCTSVSYKSWSYIRNDAFRTADNLIRDLVDIVSKNGNLLINIGPRPDGTIPEEAVETMEGMGAWLEANKESIYETRPWKLAEEGPTRRMEKLTGFDEKPRNFSPEDFRFTTSKDGRNLYVIQMKPAPGSSAPILIRSLATITIRDVQALAGGNIKWNADRNGLSIRCKTGSDTPRVFKVVL